jgi:hypothetical protein
MKNIKEKQFLVNMALALGQTPDPALIKEINEHKELMDSITTRGDEFGDFLAQLAQLKNEVETVKQVVEVKKQYFDTDNYPKPPTLDELMALVPDEVIEPIVEKQVEEKPIELKVKEKLSPLITAASEHITKEVQMEAASFQQPEIDPMSRTLDDLRNKIKQLENWISKIAATGPGSGEVNLLRLDDVDTSAIGNGKFLRYSAANAKIEFATVTGGSAAEEDTLATVTDRGNVTTNGITVNNANANFFAVNTSANFAVTTGQIAWNPADLTFDMGMANGVTLQVGQEQYIKIKAGEAIADGEAVMFGGTSGEHILGLRNNMSAPGYIPEYFIGVATQNFTNNQFGYVTVFGKINGLNTLAYTVGDLLYADPAVIGGLTNVEPISPNPHILVAAVTKRAGGDGHILVRPTFRDSLSNLNDVNITSPTAGQVLVYQGNVWNNGNITSANVTELTNLYFTNARSVAALTAGTNITLAANGLISSTASGGSSNLLAVSSAIVPDTDSVYNLGTANLRWGTLFLANNTINLGGSLISSDGTGTITISSSGAVLPVNSKVTVDGADKQIALVGNTGAIATVVPFFTKELGLNTTATNFTFGANPDDFVFTNFTFSNGSTITQSARALFYF